MLEYGIDRNQLCETLGFKYSTVSEWLSAKKYPRMDKIEQLAEYFGVKKSDLIEDSTPNAEIISTGENIYKIPLFNSVSAGFGTYACSDIVDYIPLHITNLVDVPEMLCIKVTGDSMYPKIEDGDIIVVRKQDSVDSGSIAVVILDGEEGFVKRIVYGRDTIELQSINPEYAPKVFKGADVLRVRVVGLVKQIIKTL
jgi:repressor LexA